MCLVCNAQFLPVYYQFFAVYQQPVISNQVYESEFQFSSLPKQPSFCALIVVSKWADQQNINLAPGYQISLSKSSILSGFLGFKTISELELTSFSPSVFLQLQSNHAHLNYRALCQLFPELEIGVNANYSFSYFPLSCYLESEINTIAKTWIAGFQYQFKPGFSFAIGSGNLHQFQIAIQANTHNLNWSISFKSSHYGLHSSNAVIWK